MAQVTVRIRDDVELRVQVVGEVGPGLVLLAGGGGDARQYERLQFQLDSNGMRSAAVNLRGANGSSGPLDELTMHDFASDVAAVIEHLGWAPVHVVGRAWGNRLARCVAADRPELVRSVVLMAAGGKATPDPAALAAMSRLVAGDFSDAEERRRLVHESTLVPASGAGLDDRNASQLWPELMRAQSRAGELTPVDDWWHAGTAPMLVLQGLEDKLAPPANGHLLRDELGDRVTVIDLPDAGHSVLGSQPKRAFEEVRRWVGYFDSGVGVVADRQYPPTSPGSPGA